MTVGVDEISPDMFGAMRCLRDGAPLGRSARLALPELLKRGLACKNSWLVILSDEGMRLLADADARAEREVAAIARGDSPIPAKPSAPRRKTRVELARLLMPRPEEVDVVIRALLMLQEEKHDEEDLVKMAETARSMLARAGVKF